MDKKVEIVVKKKNKRRNRRRTNKKGAQKVQAAKKNVSEKKETSLKIESKLKTLAGVEGKKLISPTSDTVYTGIPLFKQVLEDGQVEDIVLNCQIAVSRIQCKYPANFMYQNADALTPSYLAGYLALFVLEYGFRRKLVSFEFGTFPNGIFPDDFAIPSGLATFAANYYSCHKGPIYERKINMKNDFSFGGAFISRTFAANSFANIQDIVDPNGAGLQNTIFDQTLGVYSIRDGSVGSPGYDALVNVPPFPSFNLLTGANPLYTRSALLQAYSDFFVSSDLDTITAKEGFAVQSGDGSSFMHPLGTTFPITWNNANHTAGAFAGTLSELSMVYRPTFGVQSSQIVPSPYTAHYRSCMWMPSISNGSVTNLYGGDSPVTRVAAALQMYWYLVLTGKRTNLFFTGDLFKSFTLYKLQIPRSFSSIVDDPIDYVGLLRKMIVAYFDYRSKTTNSNFAFNSNEFFIVYSAIDTELRAKIQETGHLDLTYAIGAIKDVTTFGNFLVARAGLDSTDLLFSNMIRREIGVTSHGGKLVIPVCNYNFSSDGTATNAMSIKNVSSVASSPLNPTSVMATQAFNGLAGTLPQFPTVYTPVNFMSSAIPIIPDGNGNFSSNGYEYTGYNVPATFPASIDGVNATIISYLSKAPAILESYSTLLSDALSINENTTQAPPPLVGNLGGATNLCLRILKLLAAPNAADYQMYANMLAMNGNTVALTVANPRLAVPYFCEEICTYEIVNTAGIVSAFVFGVHSLYSVQNGAPLLYNLLGYYKANALIEPNLMKTTYAQTSGAETPILKMFYSQFNKHTGTSTVIGKSVKFTDCYKEPMVALGNILSQAIRSPNFPMLSKGACKAAKFGLSFTPAAGVSSYVDCDVIEKWTKRAQAAYNNMTKTVT